MPTVGHSSDDFSSPTSDSSDSDEEDEPDTAGHTSTYLETEPSAMEFRDKILSVAPGEGSRPSGLLQDAFAEELCFPNIYCGFRRPPLKGTYQGLVKWELRNVDRRAASCIDNIFFKLRKCNAEKVTSVANIRLRKSKLSGKSDLRVSHLLNQADRSALLKANIGFTDLKARRGSPDYLEQGKKHLFAQMRQLGPPHFFFTTSMADTKWGDLLVCLSRLVDKKSITAQQAVALPWEEKARLVRSDPVTCARFFRHRMDCMMRVLKLCPDMVGTLLDFFSQDEFQHRGSPHSHTVLWTAEPKVYNVHPNEEVIRYIDHHVTVEPSEDLRDELFKLQIHKHGKSCRRRRDGVTVCRFSFPWPPMEETDIICPLDESISPTDRTLHCSNFVRIRNLLRSIEQSEDEAIEAYTFNKFLAELGLDRREYKLALGSNLQHPTVFLRRRLSSMNVNAFNKHVLKLWKANMDLQYCLDPYAVASYLVSYMMKGNKEMSTLMQRACQEARAGNETVKEVLRHMGNVFLKANEVCAQQAVYLTIGLPLRQSSRSCIFIPTSPPEERTFILKQEEELSRSDPDSRDFAAKSIVEHYACRPRCLELDSVCLAVFASMYERKRTDRFTEPTDFDDDNPDPESSFQNTETSAQEKPLKTVRGYGLRKRPKIIRYRNYSKEADPENWFRESLLLFYPWRPFGKSRQTQRFTRKRRHAPAGLRKCCFISRMPEF